MGQLTFRAATQPLVPPRRVRLCPSFQTKPLSENMKKRWAGRHKRAVKAGWLFGGRHGLELMSGGFHYHPAEDGSSCGHREVLCQLHRSGVVIVMSCIYSNLRDITPELAIINAKVRILHLQVAGSGGCSDVPSVRCRCNLDLMLRVFVRRQAPCSAGQGYKRLEMSRVPRRQNEGYGHTPRRSDGVLQLPFCSRVRRRYQNRTEERSNSDALYQLPLREEDHSK